MASMRILVIGIASTLATLCWSAYRFTVSIGQFSRACLNGNDWNGSLALDIEIAQRLAFEAILDLPPSFIGHRDAPWHRLAGHAGGNIDGVAPNVELVAFLPDDACHDRTNMDANPDRPAKLSVDRRSGHLETAKHRRFQRVICGLE